MDIDAIQERPGDALLIFGDGGRGTGARLDGIAVIAAGTDVWFLAMVKVEGKMLADPELQLNKCMPYIWCFCVQSVQYLAVKLSIFSRFCISSILVAVK